MTADKLREILLKCPECEAGANILQGKDTPANIMTNVLTLVEAFDNFQEEPGSSFSLRKWVSDPMDRRTVFLCNFSEIEQSMRPLLSLIIDLTSKYIFALPNTDDYHIMFFIDEFATLQPLPSITKLLAQGRSKGVSCWLAVQDMGQLNTLYGQQSSTIVSSCSNMLIFSVSDPRTAKFLSETIGDREVERLSKSKGHTDGNGRSGQSQSTSENYSSNTEMLILTSEIQQLPSLTAFLKLSQYSFCKIPIAIMPLRDKNVPFKMRPEI